MHKQEVTIYDVAREAKVSMATVSRVVNGNNNVRQATRQRVLDVINRLHYEPNSVAQGLASKKTTTVGLVLPDLTNMFFAELSQGINDIATIYRYNIILSTVENELMAEKDVIQSLLNKQVDGIIYMSDYMSKDVEELFNRSHTPVVLASTIDMHCSLPSVRIDYSKAMREMLDLLYNNGKKNLALVVEDFDATVNCQLNRPIFESFVKKHKLGIPRIYRNCGSYSDGYNLFAQLEQEKVNGVIVTNDMAAAGIVNAAVAHGVKIPDDFEIISEGSTIVSQVVRPSLSIVRSPLYDIGAVAMRMLTKLMGDEELNHRNVILPYKFYNNETTMGD